MSKVIIVGAGLAGSLLSIYLAKRGFKVDVFEARGDMRSEEVAAGRSINLALSDRGIAALREIGMDEYMLAEAVPMYGRMVHPIEGETKLLRYSGRDGEYINSVSRSGLNIALINEAEKYDGINFVFDERCIDFDPVSGEVSFASGRTARGDTVIATDGAGSAVRQSMERTLQDFESSSVFLEHGYKELHIPAGEGGEFSLEKNALHIWPRHQFMMIALPNSDGSFTCTLFLARKSEPGSVVTGDLGVGPGFVEENSPVATADFRRQTAFDQLNKPEAVMDFFNREFPDAVSLMPTLAEDFFENPTGELGTLKCWPWNVSGKALLLGDSAHAVVPFYCQGMNCAFEDVRVLDSLIEKHGANWELVYGEYGEIRNVNTDAIADMDEENFYELRYATANPIFQRKRAVETQLEQKYPDYFSKYSMVTFREDLPYSVAKEKGTAQDKLLMWICARVEDTSKLDLDLVMNQIRQIK
jgi:kynurenine 3-monooxygenase